MSCVIFMGPSLVDCSFHALALYSFRNIVMLSGGSLIAWRTKKQVVVSRSSAETELHAMILVTTEVTWLRWLLEDYGVPFSTSTSLLFGSTIAISIARDPLKHELTEHIGVDAYYI
jgi:hypothetical protein